MLDTHQGCNTAAYHSKASNAVEDSQISFCCTSCYKTCRATKLYPHNNKPVKYNFILSTLTSHMSDVDLSKAEHKQHEIVIISRRQGKWSSVCCHSLSSEIKSTKKNKIYLPNESSVCVRGRSFLMMSFWEAVETVKSYQSLQKTHINNIGLQLKTEM